MKCFGWVALVAGVAWAAADQDPVPTVDERDVDLLRSTDIHLRESAGLRLASLSLSFVPALRRHAESESDLEVRERLMDAVRRICVRESERQLGEGRVEEALHAIAAAETDVEKVDDLVRRVKAGVEEELRIGFPTGPGRDECCWDLTLIADLIREDYGPWGIAVLLDCLERQDPQIPAFALLREWEDIAPCVVRALAQGSPARRNEACSLLHAMVFLDGKTLTADETLTQALQALTCQTDPGTRQRSQELLDRLRPDTNCGGR